MRKYMLIAALIITLLHTARLFSGEDVTTVWNGESKGGGKGWCGPEGHSSLLKKTGVGRNGSTGLVFNGDGDQWIGGGWNLFGWWPANAGVDASQYKNLVFWLKVEGADPCGLAVNMVSSGGTEKQTSGSAVVSEYCPTYADGQWHEIVIPLVDLLNRAAAPGFDPKSFWQLDFNTWAPDKRTFAIFFDDIGFDNRTVRPHTVWVRLPEAREAVKISGEAYDVHAKVDIGASGTPISPWIYGVAMADPKLCKEMGVTIRRLGGNPITPMNWKESFSSKGADWFYSNEGISTPPEKNWAINFHQENKQAGLETYQTLPMMGRVAKDGSSVAFDITKYPDQTDWAGKHQPQDPHANGGSGVQFVRSSDGQVEKDAKGNPITRLIQPDPNDTSIEMSPEEQTEMLRYMVETKKYGTADKDGIKFIALDNEPMIWDTTHRGMHPAPVSYDELWERTKTYASLYHKIDPNVQISCATFWGWTAYLFSAKDRADCEAGRGDWTCPPDYAAHGKEYLTPWLLKKLAAYEKETGQRLCHTLDFHFYPQTGIYMAGTPNDPKVMQGRVDETRVLWDPEYKDPSWMGKEVGKVIKLIPRMKQWVKECYPGTKIALGEYCFGGEQDLSGAIAQAELLGIFAREGLDYAFYWYAPAPNSPQYFAFKMLRNPDGKNSVIGDRNLPVASDASLTVSIYAAKNATNGVLSFVLVNKKVTQDARVTLKLSAKVPEQSAIPYEYSSRDCFAIGQLPALTVGGDTIVLDLPAFSVLRIDLKTR